MRLPVLATWSAFLFLFITLVVVAPSNVHAQRTSAVAARYRQTAKSSPRNILELDGSSDFDALIASQRDFSISLLLTAVNSPPVQCGPCKSFQPTYESLAQGFRKASSGKKGTSDLHVFSYLEFAKGREVFQKLQLQYAPVLLYFPPTIGSRAPPKPEPEQYDFNRLGFDGNDVAADLSKRIGVQIPFSKPFPWQLAGTVSAITATLALMIVFIFPPLIRAVSGGQTDNLLRPKVVFGFLVQVIVLATITIMCAGHMWNGIRNAPYVTADSSGKPQYFASGFQNQNAAETQIVAVICTSLFLCAFWLLILFTDHLFFLHKDGILSFSVVSLAVLVPTQRDSVKQRAAIYVWSAILLSAFSLLLYIFRLKNPSYPFRLFF